MRKKKKKYFDDGKDDNDIDLNEENDIYGCRKRLNYFFCKFTYFMILKQ